MFINDIGDCVDNLTTCKLYADDVKLYTSFDWGSDPDSLHASLSGIQQWATAWQLKLNPMKCSVLHLGHGNPESGSFIDNVPLSSVNLIRDLGVSYDFNLYFSQYIDKIVAKAY